jgi:hypothetical protein
MAAVWMAWTFAREGDEEVDGGLRSRGGIEFAEMRPLHLYNHVTALSPFKNLANNCFIAWPPLAFHFHGHGGHDWRRRRGVDGDE